MSLESTESRCRRLMRGRFGRISTPGTRILIILTAILFAVGMAFLGLAAALGDSHQTEEQKQIRWLTGTGGVSAVNAIVSSVRQSCASVRKSTRSPRSSLRTM